jgi:hypothetical protein
MYPAYIFSLDRVIFNPESRQHLVPKKNTTSGWDAYWENCARDPTLPFAAVVDVLLRNGASSHCAGLAPLFFFVSSRPDSFMLDTQDQLARHFEGYMNASMRPSRAFVCLRREGERSGDQSLRLTELIKSHNGLPIYGYVASKNLCTALLKEYPFAQIHRNT